MEINKRKIYPGICYLVQKKIKPTSMKKIILILSIALTSCTVSTKVADVTGIEYLQRQDYVVKDEQTSKAVTQRFYILFIPIVRVGAKDTEARDAKALSKMLQDNSADGVIAAKYVRKKWCVPLIVFNYSNRSTTLTGKPYTVKTDKK